MRIRFTGCRREVMWCVCAFGWCLSWSWWLVGDAGQRNTEQGGQKITFLKSLRHERAWGCWRTAFAQYSWWPEFRVYGFSGGRMGWRNEQGISHWRPCVPCWEGWAWRHWQPSRQEMIIAVFQNDHSRRIFQQNRWEVGPESILRRKRKWINIK